MMEPNKFYWKFELTWSRLLIITPLFLFIWHEYDRVYDIHGWVRGFAFCWRRSKVLENGGLLFEHNFTYYFDVLSMLEYVESK